MNWVPEVASNLASKVDAVIWFITVISLVFFILISIFLVYFAIRYRRRQENEETPYITGSHVLETIWTIIPSILLIVIFVYGFVVYKDMRTPPEDSLEVTVIGRQWLWQFKYNNGKTTLNELYIPEGRPIKLVMTSEDVLHSFFVPAFRVKQDLVGGMYTYLWFTPTKTGTYELYCTEYCGTGHSTMLGKVIVMSPQEYEKWEKGEEEKAVASLPPAELGKQLYTQRGCNACHSIDGSSLVGPTWKGLYGHEVVLQDGTKVTADENYIREAILEPQAKMVKGFGPVMPSFKGVISDDEISDLIAYIKTLK
ncbi:MAG: cytochrome C oxidase subunit II, transmembrane region, cytochrome c oxidase subunit II [Candidatus Dadabacteria bacterium CSP1-2]|nr:MAG: cytochrome C oxidase subunit II, transmembrane region, cytochrome c oxidase subunit II [Candidatus Dadabacteria bacterium CSP1-2]